MIARNVVAAGVAGLLVGGVAIALATGAFGVGGSPDRARIEAVVRDYVLTHPEIIPEAMERLQQRETAKVVAANRAAYETPFAGAWAGAENGDVVLVEFFDYACGFCRQTNADIDRLLAEDKNLKVVWRELPVLGNDSVIAAQTSLAAAEQGKFRSFYQKMFEAARPSLSALDAARTASGIGKPPPTPAHEREIQKNYELARAIGASGTPTFVVADQVLQGAVGYDVLKAAIAKARAK